MIRKRQRDPQMVLVVIMWAGFLVLIATMIGLTFYAMCGDGQQRCTP